MADRVKRCSSPTWPHRARKYPPGPSPSSSLRQAPAEGDSRIVQKRSPKNGQGNLKRQVEIEQKQIVTPGKGHKNHRCSNKKYTIPPGGGGLAVATCTARRRRSARQTSFKPRSKPAQRVERLHPLIQRSFRANDEAMDNTQVPGT